MLKVAFTGAHGTGKTTLIRRLLPKISFLGRVRSCREAPRLIINQIGDNDFFQRSNNTPVRQMLIFLEHLVEERRQGQNTDALIIDRTLVDHLSYTSVLFPEIETSSEFRVCKNIAFESLGEYDLLFKLPIEFPVVGDGIREADPEFQKKIDQAINRFLKEAGAKVSVLRGNVEKRVFTAQNQIRNQIRET